jgi:hypothetical protein
MPSSFGILVTGGHRRHPASGLNWGRRFSQPAPFFRRVCLSRPETLSLPGSNNLSSISVADRLGSYRLRAVRNRPGDPPRRPAWGRYTVDEKFRLRNLS